MDRPAHSDYSLIPGNDCDDTDEAQKEQEAPAVPIESLMEAREKLSEKELEVLKRLEDFTLLWESRKAPLDEELMQVRRQIMKVDADIADAEQVVVEPDMPEPPGPPSLAWVEGTSFPIVCNCIVALNLASMIFSVQLERLGIADLVDNVFLVWYIFELGSRTAYHQKNLYLGKIHIVSWNWLDLMIVFGGILDQWLMAIVFVLSGSGPQGATTALGAIKFLRFLRVLRILKFVRALLERDAHWTESPPFEIFMSGVIASNAVVMSLELDVQWSGWVIVENAFMLIYTFELTMKLKLQGSSFFVNVENLIWNYLDILLVVGGALDLWLFPVISMVQGVLGEAPDDGMSTGMVSRIMSLLRLMRIMRVLRLVRLLKTIKPLYRLLLGVIESLKAMQWVMILTLLMLYAGAIFWTSLVGKGLIYGGKPPPAGVKHFGTVATSLFSLFRIMNGDTSVVGSVTQTVFGQLLFAVFMVLSNWAILAILTSVVSDNMISASQAAMEEDKKKDREDEYCKCVGRLNALFREIDKDQSGCINAAEWNELCGDTGLFQELSAATSHSAKDLHDLFRCLAASKVNIDQSSGGAHSTDMNTMYFEDFIEHLRITADPADKRCVLQVMAKLQLLEVKLEKHINDLWSAFAVGQPGPVLVQNEVPVQSEIPVQNEVPEQGEALPTSAPACSRASKPPTPPSDTPKSPTPPSGTPRVERKSTQPASPAGSARGSIRLSGRRPSSSSTPRTMRSKGLQPPDGITKL